MAVSKADNGLQDQINNLNSNLNDFHFHALFTDGQHTKVRVNYDKGVSGGSVFIISAQSGITFNACVYHTNSSSSGSIANFGSNNISVAHDSTGMTLTMTNYLAGILISTFPVSVINNYA